MHGDHPAPCGPEEWEQIFSIFFSIFFIGIHILLPLDTEVSVLTDFKKD